MELILTFTPTFIITILSVTIGTETSLEEW